MHVRPALRRRTRWVALPAAALAMVALVTSCLLDRVGGAFAHQPEELSRALSADARRLVDAAFAGVKDVALADHHVHVVGLGRGGSGAYVNPAMQTWWHPIRHLKFLVYVGAAGVDDLDWADQQYVDRLLRLIRGLPRRFPHRIMAFDRHYRADGTVDAEKTEFYVPNAYVFELARRHPGLLVPTISVHPYRKDAVAALRRWARKGARLLKWLPNAMGIDPSNPKLDAFYRAMKELGITLLTHAGEEKAVEAEEDQRLGNPLLLRRALEHGVKVIVAHCASLGQNPDLDRPDRPLTDNFDLFMRLMGDERYDGLLFGEISAMTQFNRLGKPLLTLLERPDLHRRLVNGSDYPLPAINVIIRTGALVDARLITKRQRALLNEVYDVNPLLFDFVVKRTIRHPRTGARLSPAIFAAHPEITPL